ncbi:hypothetical protein GTQ99_22750, partial [Kineococcus sp. T13]
GLSERLSPRRIGLLTRPGEQHPCLAVLELARPVAAEPAPRFERTRVGDAPQDAWAVLAEQDVVPARLPDASLAASPGDRPTEAARDPEEDPVGDAGTAVWAEAARTALLGRAVPTPQVPVVHLTEPGRVPRVDDVGAWLCRMLRICHDRLPDDEPGGPDPDPWPPPRQGPESGSAPMHPTATTEG